MARLTPLTSSGTPVRALAAGEGLYRVRMDMVGADDVNRVLVGLDERAGDLSPAWPAVDSVISQVITQQFASEGQHGGSPWAPLAPRTQAARRRGGIGPAHPILRRTGALMQSLISPSGNGSVSVHLPLAYRRGSAIEYAGFHQHGTARMPRRAPVQLTFDDASEIMRPIRLHLTGKNPNRTARQDAKLRSSFQQGPGGIP